MSDLVREYLLCSTVFLWATIMNCPVDGLQLAPQAVCLICCFLDDLTWVISSAGCVGFLMSQIWTPLLPHTVIMLDWLGWILRFLPTEAISSSLQVEREITEWTSFSLMSSLFTSCPQWRSKELLLFSSSIQYTFCLVLVVWSQEYSKLTTCLARSVNLTAPSSPADRTPKLE